jgi:hypothetical protein
MTAPTPLLAPDLEPGKPVSPALPPRSTLAARPPLAPPPESTHRARPQAQATIDGKTVSSASLRFSLDSVLTGSAATCAGAPSRKLLQAAEGYVLVTVYFGERWLPGR